ncbi:MAG: hypothetical protein H7343_24225 [Undibacterium sp.]|nr:hypothetical protein [Opitutaceae bacterium]
MHALQAILRGRFVLEQIKAFSVQMRGGAVRYQAQVLKKVRVPAAASLAPELLLRLEAVAGSADQAAIDETTAEAFGF